VSSEDQGGANWSVAKRHPGKTAWALVTGLACDSLVSTYVHAGCRWRFPVLLHATLLSATHATTML